MYGRNDRSDRGTGTNKRLRGNGSRPMCDHHPNTFDHTTEECRVQEWIDLRNSVASVRVDVFQETGRLDTALQAAIVAATTTTNLTVTGLATRVEHVERTVQGIVNDITNAGNRITAVEDLGNRITALENLGNRITAVETHQRTAATAAQGMTNELDTFRADCQQLLQKLTALEHLENQRQLGQG